MLRRAGYDDVTVFERGERVGGVWNHNTYPGAACDVPSHLYEFSFEPNPRWSRRYAPQAEIQAYLEDVARAQRRARPRSARAPRCTQRALGRAARQVGAADERRAARGRRADHRLRPAVGARVPPLPGLESFAGPAFHTARWRHDVDLAGKRVAVIGTGCSAIQVVPAIQPLGRAASTSTSARPAGRSRRWTTPTASARSGCSSASRCCSGSTAWRCSRSWSSARPR